jgi:predicted amino acid-binding ACT domain protein
MKNLFFTLMAVALFINNSVAQNSRQSESNTCPEFMVSPNIYAGVEIGTRGVIPTIIRFEEAENGKTSFINLSRDLMSVNTNPSKAKTISDIDCTVDFVSRYVNVFRNDPYNVPDKRIVIMMSSTLKAKLNKNDSLFYALKDKIKRRTGLQLQIFSEKEDGGDKVNHLIVDEEFTNNEVNVFDIGMQSIKGGYNSGTQVTSFATEGSINTINEYVKAEIEKQHLDITVARDRSIIGKMAEEQFITKYLSQMQFNSKSANVVCGGNMVFAMMAWYKAESFGEKRMNPFFTSYVYDFYTTLINSKSREEFFKNNRAKDNAVLTMTGKARLADAKVSLGNIELLVGAAILKATCDNLEKKGIKNFFYDDQMMNSGLRYYLYKRYKNVATPAQSDSGN